MVNCYCQFDTETLGNSLSVPVSVSLSVGSGPGLDQTEKVSWAPTFFLFCSWQWTWCEQLPHVPNTTPSHVMDCTPSLPKQWSSNKPFLLYTDWFFYYQILCHSRKRQLTHVIFKKSLQSALYFTCSPYVHSWMPPKCWDTVWFVLDTSSCGITQSLIV